MRRSEFWQIKAFKTLTWKLTTTQNFEQQPKEKRAKMEAREGESGDQAEKEGED